MYSRLGASKPADFGFFLPVGAHHAHAGQIFLRLGGEHRERGLNLSVQRMNLAAKDPDHDGHNGDGKQNINAERRRNPEHQDYGEHHGGNRVGAVHDARARGPCAPSSNRSCSATSIRRCDCARRIPAPSPPAWRADHFAGRTRCRAKVRSEFAASSTKKLPESRKS